MKRFSLIEDILHFLYPCVCFVGEDTRFLQRESKVLNSMEGVKCNEVQGAVYAFPRITIPKRAIEEAKVPVPPPLPRLWTSAYEAIRPSKKKVSRPDFCKKESGQPVFFIYYFLLHAFFTHYYLPPGIRWSS